MLTKQIEQSRFECSHGVYGHPRIVRLDSTDPGITALELPADRLQNIREGAKRLSQHDRLHEIQCLPDRFSTGYFARAGMPGIVFEDDQIAGE